jgi:hypothetical protein
MFVRLTEAQRTGAPFVARPVWLALFLVWGRASALSEVSAAEVHLLSVCVASLLPKRRGARNRTRDDVKENSSEAPFLGQTEMDVEPSTWLGGEALFERRQWPYVLLYCL